MGFSVRNKVDIIRISPELKELIEQALSSNDSEYIRLDADDLVDSWKINYNDLIGKITDLESELKELGISDYIEFNILDSYPKTLEYIDLNPEIVSYFEFSNKENKLKTYNYNINGKEVICELELNENVGGIAVSGYTFDKNQTLTNEELSIIQAKLFNDVNELYNETFIRNDKENDIDIDITDDMY